MIFFSLLHNGKNRKEILVRSSFFLIILYVFSKLWQATQFADGTNPQSMIWYLFITELITLSIPLVQIEIENDIRSGDVAYQLLKPVSYLWLKISESIGAFIFRYLILMVIGIPFCIYLSEFVPPLHILLTTYILAGIAGLAFILFHTTIGLLAFKLQDSSPIFWIWQRSSFLFGGLLIPLDFYPWYLKGISYLLPFASLLYAPARLVINFNAENVFIALGGLLFWGLVALFLAKGLYGRMLKSLKINGG